MASTLSENWGKDLNGMPNITITNISEYIGIERSITKGYKFFVEEYVHDIFTNTDGINFTCKAKCFASQRKNQSPHQIVMEMLGSCNNIKATCSCKAGYA